MRIPVCSADLPVGFNKVAKYLGRHWPNSPLPLSQSRERLAMMMGYSSAYAVARETVDEASIIDLPWEDALGEIARRAISTWKLEPTAFQSLIIKTPWHELTAGDRKRHQLSVDGDNVASISVTQEVRISCSPSKHWGCAGNGSMRYTKQPPTNPIWRLVVVSSDKQRLWVRYWRTKPAPEMLSRCILTALKEHGGQLTLVIPHVLEKEYPKLEFVRISAHATRAPRDQADAGVHFVRRADTFLDKLDTDLDEISEEQASPEEIAQASCESELLCLNAYVERDGFHWLNDPDDDYNLSQSMASVICKSRGRDPKDGEWRYERAPLGSHPNRIDAPTPERDMVEHLLSGGQLPKLRPGFDFTEDEHEDFVVVARIMSEIRRQGRTPELMSALGEKVVEFNHAPYVARRYEQYCKGICRHDVGWVFGHKSAEANLFAEAAAKVVDRTFVHIDREGRERALSFYILEARCETKGDQTRDVLGLPRHCEVASILHPAWTDATKLLIDPYRTNYSDYYGLELNDIPRLCFDALGRVEWHEGYSSYNEPNLTKAHCLSKHSAQTPATLQFYMIAKGHRNAGLAVDENVLWQAFRHAETAVNQRLEGWGTGTRLSFTRILRPTEATAHIWKLTAEERIVLRREAQEAAAVDGA